MVWSRQDLLFFDRVEFQKDSNICPSSPLIHYACDWKRPWPPLSKCKDYFGPHESLIVPFFYLEMVSFLFATCTNGSIRTIWTR